MNIWSKRIKEKRKEANLTLLEVAKYLGVTEATVQRYESGNIKNIPYEFICKFADLFHCSPSYIMGWEEKNNNNLSNQEKALINKYRQLNEQQQYKVMGYIDSELHHNETVKESTPIYKIDNNTHSMAAEQDYTPEYVEARKIAYGAKQDEKFFVDKKAYDKVEEEEKRDLEQLNSDEELVLQNLMKSTGKTKEECYEIMKEILGLH